VCVFFRKKNKKKEGFLFRISGEKTNEVTSEPVDVWVDFALYTKGMAVRILSYVDRW